MCWSKVGDLKLSTSFNSWKYEGIVQDSVKHEELCNEVETVREFTYLGDRVSAGGDCELSVTVNR